MVKIAPSILSADFARLSDEIMTVPSADLLHVDVMDGIFVPNITIGAPVVKSLRNHTEMMLDVHLMIDRPVRYVKDFLDAGSDIITVHVEADSFEEILRAVTMIKDGGALAGLAVKPGTDLLRYGMLYQFIDVLTIMGVEPGFGGQKFIPETLSRIRAARSLLSKYNDECEIEIDGGINLETAALCGEAGADILVAGSAVFGKADREAAMEEIRDTCR